MLTNTPMGVKSISHVFFEDKNGGLFEYSSGGLQTISISVDGKQIMQDVPVLPFCTSTPNNVNRYKWQDVALEVNMNVNLSEVKISGARSANDFCVVFVTSASEVDSVKGFDYVESKRFRLRKNDSSLFESDAKALLEKTRENAKKWVAQAEVADNHGKWLEYAKEHAAKVKEYIKSLATSFGINGDEYAKNVLDAPESRTGVDNNQKIASKAYDNAKPIYDNGIPAEMGEMTLDDGSKFPTDHTSEKQNEKWEAAANAHAAKVTQYISALANAYGIDGGAYGVYGAPINDDQVAANAEAAQTAYADATTAYEAADDATMAAPEAFSEPTPATRKELADQWKQVAASHAIMVTDYINSLQYLDGATKAKYASEVVANPTADSQVSANMTCANDAHAEAVDTYKAEKPCEMFAFKPEGNDQFPDSYSKWEGGADYSGLTAPDDNNELTWTVIVIPAAVVPSGDTITPTMIYEYKKDAACNFEYEKKRATPYEYENQLIYHSYAYEWVNLLGGAWSHGQCAIERMSTFGTYALQAAFGKEESITLQKAPERIAALSIASGDMGNKAAGWLLPCDIRLTFSLSSDIEQVFPPNTDLSIIQITEGVPLSQAAYTFEPGSVSKSIRFRYDIPLVDHDMAGGKPSLMKPGYSRIYGDLTTIKSWDIFVMFIYKRIA